MQTQGFVYLQNNIIVEDFSLYKGILLMINLNNEFVRWFNNSQG